MSTHNICFRGEIRKILCGYPLLSVAMQLFSKTCLLIPIWYSTQLFPNSRVKIKVSRPEKHMITILYYDYCL